MQNRRPWLSLVIVGVAAFATPHAPAAGLVPGAGPAVLGQPLDFVAVLRLDAGEAFSPECVTAEVTLGDRALPSNAVRIALEPAAGDAQRVRVRTAVSIDEPVVAVLVHAGCGSRVSRRYVVLADPPALGPPPLQPAAFAPAHSAAPADAANVAGASGAEPGERGATAVSAGVARPVALRERAAPPAPRRTAAARTQRRAAAAPRRASAPAVARARATSLPMPVAAAAGRLTLEVAEAPRGAPGAVVDQAFDAVAQAASAVRAAASAASAASDRIAGLERTVDTLRQEARASRELAVQMRDRMASQEDQGRWLWPLLGAVLVLVALSGWLAWRLAAVQRVRQDDWRRAALPPQRADADESVPPAEAVAGKQPTAPVPFVASEIVAPVTTPGRGRGASAWPPAVAAEPEPLPAAAAAPEEAPREYPADSPMTRTEPLPPRAVAEAAARDVTIEELIDLEQQAEFFAVLGQDESAIDLLVEHLRQTGGSSPLPYLKLLEIHHRRGERAEYDRMRSRFNHRFNAYAPEWGEDLGAGRTLEDYVGTIPRLQQVWSRPLDAMAELEALLFRKSRGDLFDLPAYREVLFLYSLARDLLDREAATTGNVDFLLPMADGTEFSSTTPAPYLGLERDLRRPQRDDTDERPTSPVDLDLSSEPGRPTSIFDPLDARPERPLRR